MAKKCWRLTNFSEVGNCCVRLQPSCIAMTWVPTAGRRKPHQRTGQRSITQQVYSLPSRCSGGGWARRPCHFLCLWRGTQHQVSMCNRGADAQTCAAQPRVPPHRLTRSQKTRISAEIRVLRSAALPSTAVLRALARNTPSC